MTMSYAHDIEQAIRNALREANYTHRVTYKDMAKHSGFNENTLKSFVNNERVRLPDERETMFCLLRLSRWLSKEKDYDGLARLAIGRDKYIRKNGGATVNGCLDDEIRLGIENIGDLSTADKVNDVQTLKKKSRELGKVLSAINAEIALKEQG